MSRVLGTVARGIRAPIINAGDDLVRVCADTLIKASEEAGFVIQDRDVYAITESVVARAQGNYAAVEAIAADVRRQMGKAKLGIVFPILSRNRFATCLRAFARAEDELVIQFMLPSDEVGNHLVTDEQLYGCGLNPWQDVITEDEFRETFGVTKHRFTGVDYVDYYKQICQEEEAAVEVIFSNRPEAILAYTDTVMNCDIHTRHETRQRLQKAGARLVVGMDQILTESVNGSGWNAEYGLLGSNKATESQVKLFPRDSYQFAVSVQNEIKARTGRTIEVLVYGDGAFKDPVGKIWELADPVVSPGYTDGLIGQPQELKLKYLADNEYAGLSEAEQEAAIKTAISTKSAVDAAGEQGQGTTPRRITDLLGSLSDLISGSGDKGTPFVYIQGYFDNYAND